MPYATLDDLEQAYEGVMPPRASYLLEQAHVDLDRHVTGITDRMALPSTDAGHLPAALVKGIVLEAVMRRLRNPKGYTSERDGDYGYSFGRPGSQADARVPRSLWFTDRELDTLAPRGFSPIGTVDVIPAAPTTPEPRWQGGLDGDVWRDEQRAHFTSRDDVP